MRRVANQKDPTVAVVVRQRHAGCPGIRSKDLDIDLSPNETMDQGVWVGLSGFGGHTVDGGPPPLLHVHTAHKSRASWIEYPVLDCRAMGQSLLQPRCPEGQ